MAPHLTLVLAVVHELTDHVHHPNDAQWVVSVLVIHESVVHTRLFVAYVLELREDSAITQPSTMR